jgi:short-subunit dehydrogenase
MSVYYATKHYVLAFTEGLLEELRDNKNITITALCPPPMLTNFIREIRESPGRGGPITQFFVHRDPVLSLGTSVGPPVGRVGS